MNCYIIHCSRARSGSVRRETGGVVRRDAGRGLRRRLRSSLLGGGVGDRPARGIRRVPRRAGNACGAESAPERVRRAQATDGGHGRRHHRADGRVLAAGRRGRRRRPPPPPHQGKGVQDVFRPHPGTAGRATGGAARTRHLRVVLEAPQILGRPRQ